MKLLPEETRNLTAALDGAPLLVVINDACELLTFKLVLLVKKKRYEIKKRMEALPTGTPERNDLAQQVNCLGALMVELSEAP